MAEGRQCLNLVLIYEGIQSLTAICARAAAKGLMAGFSGNASLRLGCGSQTVLITAAGAAKGDLNPADCLLMRLDGSCLGGSGKPSSESALHLRIYEALPVCAAILHTHPPHLQALDLLLANGSSLDTDAFLNLDLYEAAMWRKRLDFVTAYPPGSSELATAAAASVADAGTELPRALWLKGHGLCALATSLKDCLCLAEELEHLARVQLSSWQKIFPARLART